MEHSKESDLRVKKTYKALYDALFSLLSRRSFNAITVNDLCSEALVSRATFYSHFRDKYDLFRYFLWEIKSQIIKDMSNYDGLEREVNQFFLSNKQLIRNIFKDANDEALALIREFMASIVVLAMKRKNIDETGGQYIVLQNFLTGGLVNLMQRIAEGDYPPEVQMVNEYLYKMIEMIMIWDAAQEQA